jgi:hypothetical protein
VQRAHQREAFAAAWHLRLQRQRKQAPAYLAYSGASQASASRTQ